LGIVENRKGGARMAETLTFTLLGRDFLFNANEVAFLGVACALSFFVGYALKRMSE